MEISLKYDLLKPYTYPGLSSLFIEAKKDNFESGSHKRSLRYKSEVDSGNYLQKSQSLSKEEENELDEKLMREFRTRCLVNTQKGPKKLGADRSLKKRKLNLALEQKDVLLFDKFGKHQNDVVNKINSTHNGLFISDVRFIGGQSGYVCGYCFKFFSDPFQFDYHCQIAECPNKCLEEDDGVVYVDKLFQLKIKRLDGLLDLDLCYNLSKLGKMFISHKLNNGEDIVKFEFFVLYEEERFVGYFSREKNSSSWNLSCILTIPKKKDAGVSTFEFQYGQFLIHFAYKLSILQLGNLGTPEKPFSDLGLLAYRKYYKYRLLDFLLEVIDMEDCDLAEVSFWEISKVTGMVKNDLLFALESLGSFEYNRNLKKVKVKTHLLNKWKQNKNYIAWKATICTFNENNFTKMFHLSLKQNEQKPLVNQNSELIKQSIEEFGKDNWITVSIPTEKHLYRKVTSSVHSSYVDSL